MPWAWQELQRRAQAGRLSCSEAGKLLDDFTARLRRDHPRGYDRPLNWFVHLAKDLGNRGLVSEAHILPFLEAFHGNPSLQRPPRLRESDRALKLECRWGSEWDRKLFGVVLLNEMRSITLDGQPLTPSDSWVGHSTRNQFFGRFELPALAPGKHVIRCEIESAFINEADTAGLPSNAPATDWPPARRQWIREARAVLMVYPENAQIVSLTQDPAVDPVAFGGLSVKKALVRSKGNRATAVIVLNLDGNFFVPHQLRRDLALGRPGLPLRQFLVCEDGRQPFLQRE